MQFFLVGMAHFASTTGGRGWVQNLGTAMYAIASSSGSIFFALNFGDEGALCPVCVIDIFKLTWEQVAHPSKLGSTVHASFKGHNRPTLWHSGTGVLSSPSRPHPVSK